MARKLIEYSPLPEKPVVHRLPKREREWMKRAINEASAQDESVEGTRIQFWLRPLGLQDFDGREIVAATNQEPDGPIDVVDPRLNHGTLTDEQVFEYVDMVYGEPPLMFVRQSDKES